MEKLCAARVDTPIGEIHALASSRGLCALEFLLPARQILLKARLSRWFGESQIEWRTNEFIEQAKVWLGQYFNGAWGQLRSPMLDLRGTSFELKIWDELRSIQFGETESYNGLAAKVGCPKGARAAGGASRRNPMSIMVPCHRIVGSTGELTGYGGGIEQKRYLLEHERLHRFNSNCQNGEGIYDGHEERLSTL
ncbi:MAG: methylated-DNA--[protein]-cysteine S-methyltransferase [Proteobacteria bacterium]|nr:methylated-DNA--[protein]-cysteine S-methyltransferase [Pseudomonadota bacterium]